VLYIIPVRAKIITTEYTLPNFTIDLCQCMDWITAHSHEMWTICLHYSYESVARFLQRFMTFCRKRCSHCARHRTTQRHRTMSSDVVHSVNTDVHSGLFLWLNFVFCHKTYAGDFGCGILLKICDILAAIHAIRFEKKTNKTLQEFSQLVLRIWWTAYAAGRKTVDVYLFIFLVRPTRCRQSTTG